MVNIFFLVVSSCDCEVLCAPVHWRPAVRGLEAEAGGVDERHNGQRQTAGRGRVAAAASVVDSVRLQHVVNYDSATV